MVSVKEFIRAYTGWAKDVDGAAGIQCVDLAKEHFRIAGDPNWQSAIGDYLVYSGQLYKVIAAIAANENLVVGTNIDAVSVGNELTALNNGLAQRKWVTITFDAISAYGLDTKTVDVSSNPAKFRQIVGWQLSNTTFLVPIQLYFSDTNKITCRVTNFTFNASNKNHKNRIMILTNSNNSSTKHK